MSEAVLCSIKDYIATITFNRPEAMNAFDKQMADELENITLHVRNDDNVRAVLLNGAGHLFMAGGDLQYFARGLEIMPEGVMKMIRTLNSSILNIMQMKKPVVASVHGSVAGVGMSFMMACDLIIADEKTKFTMAYSGIGVSPDGGASFNLPRLVGAKKALEWLMLSDLFDAQTALNSGLINWVVSSDKLATETAHLMKRLANAPTLSLACAKRLVNQSSYTMIEAQLEAEAKAFEYCTQSADFKMGVTAFLKKQKPEFSGK